MPSQNAPNIRVRMPRGLAERLRELAEEQGISTNTLTVALLSGATGYTLNDRTEATMTYADETLTDPDDRAAVDAILAFSAEKAYLPTAREVAEWLGADDLGALTERLERLSSDPRMPVQQRARQTGSDVRFYAQIVGEPS
jgi:hypothetical protein